MIRIFLILLVSCMAGTAFTQSIAGNWVGTVTQDEGGYRTSYTFTLYLSQEGERVIGRSRVAVDNIYAEMEVVGELHSGMFLQLKDLRIVDDTKLEGMEWCLKKYQLILKQDEDSLRLEGFWQGAVSFGGCVPGNIYLKKKKPRA